MKKIKTIIAIVILLVVNGAYAQEKDIDLFTVPLSNPEQPGILIVEQLSGSIYVEAYKGAEVIVRATVKEGEDCGDCGKKDLNRNGMKKISNTSLNIEAEEKDNVVLVKNELWNRKTDLFIKVPKDFSVRLSTVNNGDISVAGVNGEMEISNVNGHITLKDVSGSASADTTNGELKVNFTAITNGADMAFSSFNGNVDITFPSSLKANIKARSDMGDVYTDFDMIMSKNEPLVERGNSSKGYKVKIEQWVQGKINGGGPEILFKTFNGDVIIRSK